MTKFFEGVKPQILECKEFLNFTLAPVALFAGLGFPPAVDTPGPRLLFERGMRETEEQAEHVTQGGRGPEIACFLFSLPLVQFLTWLANRTHFRFCGAAALISRPPPD